MGYRTITLISGGNTVIVLEIKVIISQIIIIILNYKFNLLS